MIQNGIVSIPFREFWRFRSFPFLLLNIDPFKFQSLSGNSGVSALSQKHPLHVRLQCRFNPFQGILAFPPVYPSPMEVCNPFVSIPFREFWRFRPLEVTFGKNGWHGFNPFQGILAFPPGDIRVVICGISAVSIPFREFWRFRPLPGPRRACSGSRFNPFQGILAFPPLRQFHGDSPSVRFQSLSGNSGVSAVLPICLRPGVLVVSIPFREFWRFRR